MATLRAPVRSDVADAAVDLALRSDDRVVRLADGRDLGFTERGDPHGLPVLFFHGFGTTRVVCPPGDSAQRLGVRLISVDRPGLGLSHAQPGRRLLDWPRDVAEFTQLLGIDRFAIVGWSGGGPYALACARMLPERVSSVALVSAPAPLAASSEAGYLRPFDRRAVRAADHAPWVIRLAMWHWGRGQRRDAEGFFERSVADMCDADQAVLAEPELRGRMIANSAELYRQGGRGMYDEALVLARPWGFELTDLRTSIDIWHGVRDEVVPLPMANHLTEAIPNARLRLFPEEGHHLLYTHWPKILAALE